MTSDSDIWLLIHKFLVSDFRFLIPDYRFLISFTAWWVGRSQSSRLCWKTEEILRNWRSLWRRTNLYTVFPRWSTVYHGKGGCHFQFGISHSEAWHSKCQGNYRSIYFRAWGINKIRYLDWIEVQKLRVVRKVLELREVQGKSGRSGTSGRSGRCGRSRSFRRSGKWVGTIYHGKGRCHFRIEISHSQAWHSKCQDNYRLIHFRAWGTKKIR